MSIKRGDLFLGYCGKDASTCVAISEGYVDEYDGFTYCIAYYIYYGFYMNFDAVQLRCTQRNVVNSFYNLYM